MGGKTVQHLNEGIFRMGVVALGVAVGLAFLLT
jgi:hypothetical protein